MSSRNVGASVQERLRNIAKQRRVDTTVLLKRYAQERLLYRMSVSPVAGDFCLKGGLLLTAYNNGNLLRPTEDVDFNGFMLGATMETLRAAIVRVIETEVEDDGVRFDLGTMSIEKDRTGIVSGGKLKLLAFINTARVEVRVDVGFCNAVTPEPKLLEMPTLLEGVAPRPRVLAYPLETVISEKLHAMAQHGAANTRLKDFFDVWMLAGMYEFEGALLGEAIRNTFAGQQRPIPEMPLACLTPEFAEDKAVAWRLFLDRIDERSDIRLDVVVSDLSDFASPVMEAAAGIAEPPALWRPGEGWTPQPALAAAVALR